MDINSTNKLDTYKLLLVDGNMFANAAVDLVQFNQMKSKSENDEEQARIKMGYIYPEIVLRSFACELFMKGLILKEGKSYNNIHKLHELFNVLNNDTQETIRDCFIHTHNDMQSKIYNGDFDKDLMKISNIFIDTRYWFEKRYEVNYLFFHYFALAVEACAEVTLKK